MAKQKFRSVPDETSSLPKGIKYIIGNEAAERFSFYGMRTILVVFMTKYLHYMTEGEVGTEMSDAKANEYYHNFVAATYFFPVLGSFLSDILIGKYRTILWLSIVYCLGHLSLALMGASGLAPGSWLMVGLFLIAFGSGGIKPCVSAHVGDQFGKKNSNYFAINFGSTASTWMTPLLLKWYGPHIAFGVPGVLMALATLMFWMGRNVFIHVPPGGSRFFRETFSRDGIVAVLKLSTIYAFVAVFWGLFDQTGSSWVIQAENMDRRFLGVTWLQSQIQFVSVCHLSQRTQSLSADTHQKNLDRILSDSGQFRGCCQSAGSYRRRRHTFHRVAAVGLRPANQRRGHDFNYGA